MLDAAGRVFAQGGYHSASMDEIAELADVSKPLLYAYFDSKEGLYTAYINRTGPGAAQPAGRGCTARGPDPSLPAGSDQ
jgi:AcrR family transcriptional regulator